MKFKQSQFLAKPYSKCGDYCAKEKGRVSAFLNVIQSFAPIGKTVTLKRENTLLLNPTSKNCNTCLHPCISTIKISKKGPFTVLFLIMTPSYRLQFRFKVLFSNSETQGWERTGSFNSHAWG